MNEGFSYQIYNKLSAISGLDKKELARITLISPATLQRRAKAGRFNKNESDRLYRFVKVLEAATGLFAGDKEAAMDWLTHPVRGLGYKKPVDLLGTSVESDQILNLIGCLEHGIFV